MEPIVGIVPKNDTPPTFELDREGAVIRFYKHSQRLIRFHHVVLLAYVNVGMDFTDSDDFKMKVNKQSVVFTLVKPERGHGTIKLNKNELIALLASA